MKLIMGALAPTIGSQLRQQKIEINAEDIARADLDAEAITRLYIRGYMPESVAERMRKRLINRLAAKIV